MEHEQQVQKQPDRLDTKVRVILKNINLTELDLSECEILGEIKHVLMENPYLKLTPNIQFNHNNKPLKEFESFSAQINDFKGQIELQVTFSKFNQRTAKQHVSQLASFFESPEYYLYENFLEFNNILGKTDYISSAFENQELEALQNLQLDKLLQDNLENFNSYSFFAAKQENEQENFFQELSYSKYNPPLGEGVLQGDLIYLDFVSNENNSYCVTLNKNGCFVNSSKKSEFSCKPSTQIYSNLLELFSSLSSTFADNLALYYDIDESILYKKYSEDFKLIKNRSHLQSKWLNTIPTYNKKITQLRNLKDILKSEFHGQNFVYFRDWNEEFQSCRQYTNSDTIQQIQKIKILKKTQTDFIKAAEELTKAVVNEEIMPLNPSENKIENCYVFNNLFATYAVESLDWELPKTEVAPSTYSTINNDLRNLKNVFELDVNGLNTINTCTVEYLGHRVIVQTVIQGILHFDQKTWNCYGSIDDGKTMNWDDDFHRMIGEICDKFSLSTNSKFKDELGQEYTFNGSPEVKGIKAGDGRKYIMDLMRLSPRDANFPDSQKHECCVLRPELVKSFLFYQNIEEMYQKKKDEQQAQEVTQQNENLVLNKEKSQDNKETKTESQEQKKEQQQEIKETVELKNVVTPNEIHKHKTDEKTNEKDESHSKIQCFNPSLYTQLESFGENVEQEKQDLLKIAQFLKSNVINVFLNNVTQNPMVMPMDMEALVDSLHKNGINIRYLGYLYEQVLKTQNKYLSKLIERVVFVRAFTKYLRKIAINNNRETFLVLIVHFINLFLGNQQVKNIMENKMNNKQNGLSNQELIDKKQKKNKKKNKKKKKKTEIPHLTVDKNSSEFQVNSEELLQAIKEIVKERYSFPVEEIKTYEDLKFIKSENEKQVFLRELCLNLGLKILPREYKFIQQADDEFLPLRVQDISDFVPKSKSASFYVDILKYNNKTIENEIYNKNYQSALQMLQTTQTMIMNTYGIYNKDFIFNCSRIASLLFQLKETDKAIKLQLFVIKLSEIVFGIDHFNTAFSILELSNFLYEKKQLKECIRLHSLALKIFDIVGSIYNPNSLFCLHELTALCTESKNKIYLKNSELFGYTDERLLYFLDRLAAICAEEQDFEQASLLQARHSLILGRVLKSSPTINEQYKTNLKMKLQESEKLKVEYMSKRKQSKTN